VDAPVTAHRVDRHEVLVVQARDRLGLVLEALQVLGIQGRRERQHLEGHAPAQRELFGLVDHSHAAAPDLAYDAEVPQRPRVWQVIRRGRHRGR
jgi:hypothetical protein